MPRTRWVPLLLVVTAPLAGCQTIRDTVQTLIEDEAGGQTAELPASVRGEPLPTSARPEQLKWSTPGCRLRYRFQSDHTIEMPQFPAPTATDGLRVTGNVVMEPGPAGRTLIRNGELEISHVMHGTKRPGGIQPPDTMAEVRLEHDGSTWSEVDGPTALWSAYGSFPGLVVFWPGLPAQTRPGSETTWQLPSHERGAGMRVETERGTTKVPEGTPLPDPSPTFIPEQVELESWISVQGEPAAVLTGHATRDGEESLAGQRVAYTMEQRSTYVVLASGRLLYAHVARTTDVTMSGPEGHSMEQTQQMDARISLIDACDGATVDEPPLEQQSPEEQALAAIARLRNAVAADTNDIAVASLDPKLIEAHGRESVLDALHEHVERHGPASLGAVELPDDIQREGDRVRVIVWGPSEYFLDGYDLSLVFEVDVAGGAPEIVTIEARKQYHDDDAPLLELSAARLSTRTPPRGEPLNIE